MANTDKRLKDADDFTGLRHKWETVAVTSPTRTLTKEETGKRFIFFDSSAAVTLPLDAVADETTYRFLFVGNNGPGGSIDAGAGNLIFAAFVEQASFLQAVQQSVSGIFNFIEFEITFIGDPLGQIGSPTWIGNILLAD